MRTLTKVMLMSCIIVGIGIMSVALLPQQYSFVQGGDVVLNYSQDVEAKQLSILNGVGVVDIKHTSGSEIKITAKIELSGGNSSEKKRKKSELVIVPELVNDILLVEAKSKNGTNYWTWLRKNLNADKIKINYEIQIPRSIEIVKIYNAVGNINATDLKSSMDMEVYTGNIRGTSLSPQNFTNSIVYVGSIDLKYSDTSNVALLKNSVSVGNIVVKMPRGATYTTDDSKADSVPDKIKDVFSEQNISRVRDRLLEVAQLYTEDQTIVANKMGFGTIKVNLNP